MLDNFFDNNEDVEIENVTDEGSGAEDEKEEQTKDEKTFADGLDEEKESEYEDVCFICRRPESKTGKMFKLPNHISVCSDCMHKTMDTVSQFDYQGMLNNTNFNFDKDNGKDGRKRFPNISFVNIADLQGDGGIPNRQKLKKKKPKEKKDKAVFNINHLPAPHKIKEQLDDFGRAGLCQESDIGCRLQSL